MNLNKKIIETFKNELKEKNPHFNIENISDEDIMKIIDSAIVPISLSTTKTKATIYSNVFLQNDNKDIEALETFTSNIISYKNKLNKTAKRMIKFFLLNPIHKKINDNYTSFVKSYGKGKTYYKKRNDKMDYILFKKFFPSMVLPIIYKLKKGTLQRFPFIESKKEDNQS